MRGRAFLRHPVFSPAPNPSLRATHCLPIALLCLSLLGAAIGQQEQEVLATADSAVPSGVLAFQVTDEAGLPLPCRLTFVPEGQPTATPDLFPGVDAAQGEVAVRKNVVYSLAGKGSLSVPVGRYRVYATHGLEWSRAERLLEVTEDSQSFWATTLQHEVDTTGWVSGDFHLHTLTYSGHGDANLPERVVSLIGEGVEFAVATDHNHNTDYGPIIESLGVESRIRAVVGNEVSTPIGHFNAFPLDASRLVVDASQTDANKLFRLIREEPNAQGIVPIVQLNHPRWDGIDYFAQTGLDPITGTSAEASFSSDFDSIEVLNENTAWGYFEKYADGIETKGNRHSVLEDWFHLLDRGHRAIAVGNSDSHSVQSQFAGYPRNLIFTNNDDPSAIDAGMVAQAIRSGNVSTTTGPILRVSANSIPMGGLVPAPDGKLDLKIDVQCASWIACDRLKVIVNGFNVQTIDIERKGAALHAVHSIPITLSQDAWVVVLAEGDESLAPIVLPKDDRPALPLAIANPLRIDVDGDGLWTAPFDTALTRIASWDAQLAEENERALVHQEIRAQFEQADPAQAARLILASAQQHAKIQEDLTLFGFSSPDRNVQLAAARSLEMLGPRFLAAPNTGIGLVAKQAWKQRGRDPYADVARARALLATNLAPSKGALIADLFARHEEESIAPYVDELLPFLAPVPVLKWRTIGFFDAPTQGTIQSSHLGPEQGYAPAATFLTRTGSQRGWSNQDAEANGHLDLRLLAQDGESSENCFAYAETWVRAPAAGEYLVGFGTDDGGRVYLNDALFHEDLDRQGATPLQHVESMPLRSGWNRILFQVENGGGAFGLYFQLLEEGLTSARQPDL